MFNASYLQFHKGALCSFGGEIKTQYNSIQMYFPKLQNAALMKDSAHQQPVSLQCDLVLSGL